MSTLYLVDNPAGHPLSEDTGWLDSLLVSALTGDSLMLIGFSHDDGVIIRQRLADTIPTSAIICIDNTALEHLGGDDSELASLAVQRAADGLAPARLQRQNHAGQTARPLTDIALVNHNDQTRHDHLPSLAFISPLPPAPTGIADYSAELLPYLAKHFAITLVTDQPRVQDSLTQQFPVISPTDFTEQADQFERLLYQIGNSRYHDYQLELLKRYPGCVVLHDIYLFDAVWWMQEKHAWPDGLRQQLFTDHGYPPLVALHELTTQGADSISKLERYPVNSFVTHEATGLIVHSTFARDLDRHWRASAEHEPAIVIAHLRQLPEAVTLEHKRKARKALGVDQDACLIVSLGGINSKKLSDRLLATLLDTPLGEQTNIQLGLVGARGEDEFGQQIAASLHGHPRADKVTITGYVDRECYVQWLQAADIAVQLRQQSRGESSGTIFDAMAYGLPVVVNAHGSTTELPQQAVTMLPDEVDVTMLSRCLQELANDPDQRSVIGEAARRFVAEHLDPERIATDYRNAIEKFAHGSRRQRHEHWLNRLAKCRELHQMKDNDNALFDATRALCELDTTAPSQPPRILFDVSTIAWHDLKTGIERVTRRLADQLLRHPPAGWRIELIRWGGDDFHLARGFASDQLGIDPPAPNRPCEARAGDIYVSVEWAPALLEQAGDALQQMRARGVRCYFTVHDLLPLYLPECFPEDTPSRMRTWFECIAKLADGITCVSATVADDVRGEIAALKLAQPPWVEHFHLGADFSGPIANELMQHEQQLLKAITQPSGTTLLMVGTLEPRKGYRQVLDAIEHCWAQGAELNLCIIGKQGWAVDELARRLRQHPQNGKRLHWIEGASDALLTQLYAACDGLVAASLGEGFGLPLIEAAYHGIPILARDIPVFREVAGDYADYFHADTAQQLAQALMAWLERWQRGELSGSQGMPHHNWAASTRQWLTPILADQPIPLAVGQPQPVEPNP